jgi:parallel beta-helix repeat protein
MLLIGNYPQVTVEDCSFVGSNGNSSSKGALAIIESCASNYNRDEFILDQVTVRNCTFDGTNSGQPALRLRNSGNVLITGNTIANSNHNGILLESDTTHSRVNTLVSKTVVIQNNTINEWNAGNVADGGRGIRAALGTMAAGSSVTISGNVFRKEQTGFDSPRSPGGSPQDCGVCRLHRQSSMV